MSMDGIDRMGDDPFAGQRRAWAEQLEKAHERIAQLEVEVLNLRAKLGETAPTQPDLMPGFAGDAGPSTLHPDLTNVILHKRAPKPGTIHPEEQLPHPMD